MKKLCTILLATAAIGVGAVAFAADPAKAPAPGTKCGPGMEGGMDHPMGMRMHLKEMDTNGDGVVSREEFLKGHEAMFDRMKNKDGVISLADLAKREGMGHEGKHQDWKMHEGVHHEGMMQGHPPAPPIPPAPPAPPAPPEPPK
ncbi:MAG: hypothetical protein WCE48_05895 [Steroidobacteraceae bacterium]